MADTRETLDGCRREKLTEERQEIYGLKCAIRLAPDRQSGPCADRAVCGSVRHLKSVRRCGKALCPADRPEAIIRPSKRRGIGLDEAVRDNGVVLETVQLQRAEDVVTELPEDGFENALGLRLEDPLEPRRDGGIRRGSDVLKALALGAKAVLVGRPPAWGVAAFGSIGVQRVMELLAAEFTVSMGIAGAPNLAAIKRSMVRLPWEEYRW